MGGRGIHVKGMLTYLTAQINTALVYDTGTSVFTFVLHDSSVMQ